MDILAGVLFYGLAMIDARAEKWLEDSIGSFCESFVLIGYDYQGGEVRIMRLKDTDLETRGIQSLLDDADEELCARNAIKNGTYDEEDGVEA